MGGCKQKVTPKQEVLHIEQERHLYFPIGTQYLDLRTMKVATTPVADSQDITLQSKHLWQYRVHKYGVVHHNNYRYTTSKSITPKIDKQGEHSKDSLTHDNSNFFLKNDSGVIWIHDIPHETFTDVILYDSAGHEQWHTVVETKDTSGKKTLDFLTYTGGAVLFGNEQKTVLVHTANGSKKNLDIHYGGIITDLDGITVIGILPVDSGGIKKISYFAEDFWLQHIQGTYSSASTASNNSQYFILLYNKGKNEALLQTYNLFNNKLSWEKTITTPTGIGTARLLSYENKIIVDILEEKDKSCKIYNVRDGKILFE